MNRPAEPAGQLRTIDLLFSFSLAADLALGLAAGHGVRATYIGMRLAEHLDLTPEQLADLFYAELLMDAGCTAWTSQVAAMVLGDEIVARRELFFRSDPSDPRDVLKWLARYMAAGEGIGTRAKRMANFGLHGKEFMMEGLRNTGEVASRIAGRLGRSVDVQEALRFAFEHWDGSGPNGQRADSIPLIARIVYVTIFLEVFHHFEGRESAIRIARARRGKSLDPDVVDAFLRLVRDDSFWRGLESESVWDEIREMEPDSPYRYFDEIRLDDAARAFADFADLKSFFSAGHSRRVASLVEPMASYLGLGSLEITMVRRAALLHDIGLVAVPSFILHKPEERLSAAEWERLRLHPYYAERILSQGPAFASLIPLVATHHERPDGRGYHRGVSGAQIPVGSRIIAVADVFDELTHAGPEHGALGADAALRMMAKDVGTRFFVEPFEALAWALGRSSIDQLPVDTNGVDREWPAGLTDREIDVIRFLSTGASRRSMAKDLSVSEHTIRHHIEHIYDKLDVHTRVAATLFALEHNLLQ